MKKNELKTIISAIPEDDWRREVAYQPLRIYYSQYSAQRSYSQVNVSICVRVRIFTYLCAAICNLYRAMRYGRLFPNRLSANSAGPIDEALHILSRHKACRPCLFRRYCYRAKNSRKHTKRNALNISISCKSIISLRIEGVPRA